MFEMEMEDLQEEAAFILEKNIALHKKIRELEQQIASQKYKMDRFTLVNRMLEEKNNILQEQLKKGQVDSEEMDLEKHINEIMLFMEETTIANGIKLTNIYVTPELLDDYYYIYVRGEMAFAPGIRKLPRNIVIKAIMYDSRGHIAFENRAYVNSDSFDGYDSFCIKWNAGSKENVMSAARIRLFAVKS